LIRSKFTDEQNLLVSTARRYASVVFAMAHHVRPPVRPSVRPSVTSRGSIKMARDHHASAVSVEHRLVTDR